MGSASGDLLSLPPTKTKLWDGPSLFASATEHKQLLPFVSHSSFKYPRFTHSSICVFVLVFSSRSLVITMDEIAPEYDVVVLGTGMMMKLYPAERFLD